MRSRREKRREGGRESREGGERALAEELHGDPKLYGDVEEDEERGEVEREEERKAVAVHEVVAGGCAHTHTH